MNRWRAFCETVHLASLGIWLGFVLASGTAAAILFPTIKSLNPSLPGFQTYPRDHWLIAGGHVGQKIFMAVDIAQFTFALLAGLTFAALIGFLGLPKKRPATIIRACGLGFALAFAAGQVIILGPRMHHLMRNFWAAAQEGNITSADLFRAQFEQSHPIGSALLYGSCISVFVTLIAGLWSVSMPLASDDSLKSSSSPRYEEPALLKGRRA